MSIISELYEPGFRVVACVGHCDGGNLALCKELDVLFPIVDSVIQYQGNECVIYNFPDTPHLLKLIRNWFLDSGFTWLNGNVANKNPITDLIQGISSSEVHFCHKLSILHVVECEKNSEGRKSRLAADKQEEAPANAYFIDLINSWFDLMNRKAIIISINSIKRLFSDLQLQYLSIKYVLTHRLN
ncbi:hypothetical protein PR048_020703 [Dryococelus australis]|uniref:Transposable element P transposase n=1 Tax=Dryococelus australis TaxID=614101 RepID=A0ABQ9H710_9NEOP|nr:hypothetical protein PR048_020703 [Dryococelus australis]